MPPIAMSHLSHRPPPRGPSPWLYAVLGAVLGASVVVGGGAGVYTYRARAAARLAAKDTGGGGAVVRVVSGKGHGTGFFVSGPDDAAYVVTAYHVVQDSGAMAVERALESATGTTSTEAYPETSLVAFDSEADLAILRVNGIPRERFPRMALAKDVTKDEDVLSYGFPGSSLARRFGMVSKPGKVLSLVRFPVRDHRTKATLRNEAVPGLLVSAEIEPGFSGGPLVNGKGEVVGVNVTKDLAQRAQNGAVSVSAVRDLVAKVKPARDEHAPTPEDVRAMLERVDRDYLMLPVDRRLQRPEEDVVSETDVPKVAELAADLRGGAERVRLGKDVEIGKRAATGLLLLGAPGAPLEAFQASSTKSALDACEARNEQLSKMLGTVPLAGGPEQHDCTELAIRPLAWDLAAMAVQWEGKERSVSVSKVETVDEAERLYRAQVRFGGTPSVADVWLRADGGRLRLALFDAHGTPSGLATSFATSAPVSAFQGSWSRTEARVPRALGEDLAAEVDGEESLTVAIGEGNVASIKHRVRRRVHFTGGARLACGGSSLDLGIEQSFVGRLENGRVVAVVQHAPRALGADMARCWRAFTYEPDAVVLLKPRGDKLVMVRTSKAGFPETAELDRR